MTSLVSFISISPLLWNSVKGWGWRENCLCFRLKKSHFILKSSSEPLAVFQKRNLLSITRKCFLSISFLHKKGQVRYTKASLIWDISMHPSFCFLPKPLSKILQHPNQLIVLPILSKTLSAKLKKSKIWYDIYVNLGCSLLPRSTNSLDYRIRFYSKWPNALS